MMKNRFSKKAIAEEQFNELFWHLFFGAVFGLFSGWLLFVMDPIKGEEMIVLLGSVVSAASIAFVYSSDYKPAGIVFAFTLPITTGLVCMRLGINTSIPYTDNLLLFSRGFFPIMLIGLLLIKLDSWGEKTIKEDNGYGGPPQPPFE